MKNKVTATICITTTFFMLIFACSKSKTTQEVNPPDKKSDSEPTQAQQFVCTDAPDYGSELICAKYRGPNSDHLVKPRNNPGAGKYFSWPAGLVIDQATGEINVTTSESGMRYRIGFLKNGTTDTCFTQIIIGGATYLDHVYVLDANDTLAIPYFDANPARAAVCDVSGDDDYPGNGQAHGNDRCEFDDDEDDDNGNGVADEPLPGQQANDQNVRVRTLSGIINLKKTLNDGAFGANPVNGSSKEVTIYYRLKDCSEKALRKIKVKLTYYEKKSDIPLELVTEAEAKEASFMTSDINYTYYKPRPPQIFVTRYY